MEILYIIFTTALLLFFINYHFETLKRVNKRSEEMILKNMVYMTNQVMNYIWQQSEYNVNFNEYLYYLSRNPDRLEVAPSFEIYLANRDSINKKRIENNRLPTKLNEFDFNDFKKYNDGK